MDNSTLPIGNTLDRCITAIREQGKSVEDCLSLYPEQRDELEPLLKLASQFRSANSLDAPAEFRQSAKNRMINLISAQPRSYSLRVESHGHFRQLTERFTVVLKGFHTRLSMATVLSLLVVVLLLGSGSAVYASTNALPGDGLYPVKSTIETMQLAVPRTDTARVGLHFSFAKMRLDEVAELIKENRYQNIDPTLKNYGFQIESILNYFGSGKGLDPGQQKTLAVKVVSALTEDEAQLNAMLNQAAVYNHPAIVSALVLTRSARDRALAVLGEPASPDFGSVTPGIDSDTPTSTEAGLATRTSTPTLTPTPATSEAQMDQPTLQTTPAPPGRRTARPTLRETDELPGWPTAWPTGWPTGRPTVRTTRIPPERPTAWPTPLKFPTEWPQPPVWPGQP